DERGDVVPDRVGDDRTRAVEMEAAAGTGTDAPAACDRPRVDRSGTGRADDDLTRGVDRRPVLDGRLNRVVNRVDRKRSTEGDPCRAAVDRERSRTRNRVDD